MSTSRPVGFSIEKFANDVFAVACDRILAEFEKKEKLALHQAGLTNNRRAHLAALVKCGAERAREMVPAFADAYADAFTIHGEPSDTEAENAIEASAAQITGGAIFAHSGPIAPALSKVEHCGGTRGETLASGNREGYGRRAARRGYLGCGAGE